MDRKYDSDMYAIYTLINDICKNNIGFTMIRGKI